VGTPPPVGFTQLGTMTIKGKHHAPSFVFDVYQKN
jgi:hypothetical protein